MCACGRGAHAMWLRDQLEGVSAPFLLCGPQVLRFGGKSPHMLSWQPLNIGYVLIFVFLLIFFFDTMFCYESQPTLELENLLLRPLLLWNQSYMPPFPTWTWVFIAHQLFLGMAVVAKGLPCFLMVFDGQIGDKRARAKLFKALPPFGPHHTAAERTQ